MVASERCYAATMTELVEGVATRQTVPGTASRDRAVRTRDANNGSELPRLHGHSDAIYAVMWSLDGKRLDGRIWDANPAEIIVVGAHLSGVEKRVLVSRLQENRLWFTRLDQPGMGCDDQHRTICGQGPPRHLPGTERRGTTQPYASRPVR